MSYLDLLPFALQLLSIRRATRCGMLGGVADELFNDREMKTEKNVRSKGG